MYLKNACYGHTTTWDVANSIRKELAEFNILLVIMNMEPLVEDTTEDVTWYVQAFRVHLINMSVIEPG